MKEDYLWDKTGSDPDIEMLEDALQVFRYKEAAPPALPAKVVTLKREPFYKGLRFALSAAACISFGVLAFGIWFQVWKNNTNLGPNVAEVSRSTEVNNTQANLTLPDANQPLSPVADNSQKPTNERVKKIVKAQQAFEKNPVRAQRAFYVTNKTREIKAQPIKATMPAVRLTKEELYAYNQLMLALSITSDKLKMVKDKVEGSDE